MRFIDCTNMSNFRQFIRGDIIEGEFIWMDWCWSGVQSSHDYSVIDVSKHREVGREIAVRNKSIILLGHEVGSRQGRDQYSTTHANASTLFEEAAFSIKEGDTGSIERYYSFYNMYDYVGNYSGGVTRYDLFRDHLDYCAPSAYASEAEGFKELQAKLNLQVAMHRNRSNTPIYPVAWHKIRRKNGSIEYMSYPEMTTYLDILQGCGADGFIWWAGLSEGDYADDGVGSTNRALEVKSWNHPYRYGTEANMWVNAFKYYNWG